MNSRSVLTISVTSGLFGLYIVYALVMNSLIGVQTLEQIAPASLPAPEPPAESRLLAEQYLVTPESDPWELKARYRVRRQSSHLYYNDWVHRPYHRDDPDNAIEFTPFAMVIVNDKAQPVTMQAEVARVRFSNSFSLENPETGRPVEGALGGKVRITGPDGLKITGRNFVYSEEAAYIYSDEMVEFEFGPNRGRADGIQLDLVIDRKLISEEDFAVSGIKLITMRGKVNMELHPEKNQDFEKMIVRCDGGLVFDTNLNVATFRDRVSVMAPTGLSGGGIEQLDSLDCDILKLLFTPEITDELQAEADQKKQDDEDAFQGIEESLVLTEIIASSVGRRVTFVSQKNGIEAEMDSFHYNQMTHVATLRDPAEKVAILQRQTKIYSPMMVLQHDEAGELTSVVCDGPGELYYYDELTHELELKTTWQRSLRVRPEQKKGMYLIELEERAVVSQPKEQFGLAADTIKLRIFQAPKTTDSTHVESDTERWQGENIEPKNMLALGHVHLSHPSLQGTTDRLEVWFQKQASILPTAQKIPRNPIQPVSHQGEKTEPSVGNRAGHASMIKRENKTTQPFRAEAELIQVLLYVGDDQQDSYIGGVVTSGDVKITQTKADGSRPLEMEGDRIEVSNEDASNLNQVVHVFGSPAKITDEKMSLAGNLLNLDRASNRAWVTGPGVMMHEVHTDLNGEPLEQPELLKVWWNEKMEFDGKQAHFYDGIRTQLGTSSVKCQEMVVTLLKKLNFRDDPQQPPEGEEERTEISRLECLYGVQIDSEEYKSGKLAEIRQGEFGQLIYDRASNQTKILGPGTLYLWKKGRGIAPDSRRDDSAPSGQSEAEDSWEYLQIDFNGDIDGDLDRNITHFENGVKIVYGPVSQPGVKVDLHHLPDRGGWMRSEELDVARISDDDQDDAWLELRASGNVKLEGKDSERFRARADMVTFNEKDQKYRFRALGNRYTTIWRQKRPGDPFSRAEAKVMQFQPSTHDLELHETTSLEGIE